MDGHGVWTGVLIEGGGGGCGFEVAGPGVSRL